MSPSTPPPEGGSILKAKDRPKRDRAIDTSEEAVARRREQRLAKSAAVAINQSRTSTWKPKDLKVPHRSLIAGPGTDEVYERLTEAKSLGRRAFELQLEAARLQRAVGDARSTDAMASAAAVRAGEEPSSTDAVDAATAAFEDARRQSEATEAASIQAYGEFRALLREHKHTIKVTLDRQNKQEWAEVLGLLDKALALALTRQGRRMVTGVWSENPFKLPAGPDQNIVGALRQARGIWVSLPQTEDGVPDSKAAKLGGPHSAYPTGEQQRASVMAGAAHADGGKDPDGAPRPVRTSQGTLASSEVVR